MLVEVVGDPALAELVREVFGVEAEHLFAVADGGEIDREEVARAGRAVDIGERAALAQFAALGLGELVVGRLDRVELDPQPAVTGHADLGAHLALGLELDDAVFLPAGDLDLRGGDEVDVVLADRLAEVARDGVAQRLLACGRQTDPGFEHPPRRLAVAEAGQLAPRGRSLRNARSMSRSNSASSTSTYNLTLFPSRGSTEDFMRAAMLPVGRPPAVDRDRPRTCVGPAQSGRMTAMQFWKPHALASPHADQLDLKIGDRVRATIDLLGAPTGTEGKVILANGFNWQRYRVLFDNGAELGDLDQRNLEPIGRTAKRLAKRAKAAARGR